VSLPDPETVLVGIPAYNEAAAVGDVVAAALPHAGVVLVVDDGSDDDTADVARRAGAEVVVHERNAGYGAALRTVFAEAARRGVAHLVVLDADGQHDAGDVPRLLAEQVAGGADIVVASRFVDGAETDAPLYRRAGLFVVNGLTNFALGGASGIRVHDTQSGMRAYTGRAVASLSVDPTIGEGMGASTDILFHARDHGYAVAEVPTTVRYDVEDASTENPVTHGLGLVFNILRRSLRPGRPY
jgi:glycosyltransferase involved in cell wall biosynthesis